MCPVRHNFLALFQVWNNKVKAAPHCSHTACSRDCGLSPAFHLCPTLRRQHPFFSYHALWKLCQVLSTIPQRTNMSKGVSPPLRTEHHSYRNHGVSYVNNPNPKLSEQQWRSNPFSPLYHVLWRLKWSLVDYLMLVLTEWQQRLNTQLPTN